MSTVAISLVILLLLVGMIMVILLARKQYLDQQLREASYEARMKDVALAALGSQMNPHFIFNCLNSIKLYTQQNDSKAVGDYLDKFARLIRNNLDNARREKIVLSEEIASLELYLQLEVMRFKNKIQYFIEVDDSVRQNMELIEVPPMLIQPYVENALWHGLMHKPEGGEVRITFSQPVSEDMLQITVSDNGIGRGKARVLKSGSTTRHKSHGTSITGERIALINERYKGMATVHTEDLADEGGAAAGTMVTIQLPV